MSPPTPSSSSYCRAILLDSDACPPISGTDLYLGGAVTRDGETVICVPGSAKFVTEIKIGEEICFSNSSTTSDKGGNKKSTEKHSKSNNDHPEEKLNNVPTSNITYSKATVVCRDDRPLVGPVVTSALKGNKFKWLRGIYSKKDNAIYGIPCNANSVLRIVQTKMGTDDLEYGEYLKTVKDCSPPNTWPDGLDNLKDDDFELSVLDHDGARIVPSVEDNSVAKKRNEKNSARNQTFESSRSERRKQKKKEQLRSENKENEESTAKNDTATTQFEKESTLLVEKALVHSNTWKFHGAVIANDGNMYCVPCNSEFVLKVNIQESRFSEKEEFKQHQPYLSVLNDDFPLKGAQKWYGGILANDGNVYCTPFNSDKVLKICVEQQKVELMEIDITHINLNGRREIVDSTPELVYELHENGDRELKQIDNDEDNTNQIGGEEKGENGELRDIVTPFSLKDSYKWHGAVHDTKNDVVLCVPSHADRLLKIDVKTQMAYTFGEERLEHITREFDNHSKYKFGGGVYDSVNDKIILFPSDCEYLLVVDSKTDDIETIPLPPDTGEKVKGQNKWQNGFQSKKDNCIYAIPCDAAKVLRVKYNNGEHENSKNVHIDSQNSTHSKNTHSYIIELVPIESATGRSAEELNGIEDLSSREKWEGGVVSKDGTKLICMPQAAGRVLVIG